MINPHFHNPAVQILSLKASRQAAPQRWNLSSVMQSEPNLLIPMGQREKIEDLVPNCLPGMQIDESDESLSGSGSSRRMDGQEVKPEAAPISLG